MELDLLKRLISDVLGVDPAEITRETTFEEDLGADSLDLFEIIMGIEKELNMEVDTDLLENIKTVGDAEEMIRKTQSAKE